MLLQSVIAAGVLVGISVQGAQAQSLPSAPRPHVGIATPSAPVCEAPSGALLVSPASSSAALVAALLASGAPQTMIPVLPPGGLTGERQTLALLRHFPSVRFAMRSSDADPLAGPDMRMLADLAAALGDPRLAGARMVVAVAVDGASDGLAPLMADARARMLVASLRARGVDTARLIPLGLGQTERSGNSGAPTAYLVEIFNLDPDRPSLLPVTAEIGPEQAGLDDIIVERPAPKRRKHAAKARPAPQAAPARPQQVAASQRPAAATAAPSPSRPPANRPVIAGGGWGSGESGQTWDGSSGSGAATAGAAAAGGGSAGASTGGGSAAGASAGPGGAGHGSSSEGASTGGGAGSAAGGAAGPGAADSGNAPGRW